MVDLKQELEKYDDEHNTFHRFPDLPPELRERIYTEYFNTYNEDDNSQVPTTNQLHLSYRSPRGSASLLRVLFVLHTRSNWNSGRPKAHQRRREHH